MYTSIFAAAARSPSRQLAWRMLCGFHLLVVGACSWVAILRKPAKDISFLGVLLLIVGIVEGALLIGWRLAQMPKSRALEFLLTSPMRPSLLLFSEAAVGVLRLAYTTMLGLPFFLLLVLEGRLDGNEICPLLYMPFTWGAVTGLALAVWAYEGKGVRRVLERFCLLMVLVYLIIGVVAGEKLGQWLERLPNVFSSALIGGVRFLHTNNPFAVVERTLQTAPENALPQLALVEAVGLGIAALLLVRVCRRLQPHFHELHYRPVVDQCAKKRAPIKLRPLSWWAVKRVSHYSGRVNLWLAAGFGCLYALHLLAGECWPAWMGRKVFETFDAWFGVAGVTMALTVMFAVPAAFQYGLWDGNPQDRCRRLELLLLTRLDAMDYWRAAFAAAWKRGCGYFYVATIVWLAAAGGGQIAPAHLLTACVAALLMWLFYFTLGFRAFCTGLAANNLGLTLTVALPCLFVAANQAGWQWLAALTPPGLVYLAVAGASAALLPGLLLQAVLIVFLQRVALARCLGELRAWYGKFHGRKVVD